MNFERGKEVKEALGIEKTANTWWGESVYETLEDWHRQLNITKQSKVADILEEMAEGRYIRRRNQYFFVLRHSKSLGVKYVERKELYGEWISYEGELFKIPEE